MNYLVAYLAVLVVYLALEYLWLAGMMRPRLRRLGTGVLRETPQPGPALGFGLYYAAVLAALATGSGLFIEASEQAWAEGWLVAVFLGAILGLMAYGIRAFGNWTLVRGWGWSTALADLLWGAVVSAVAALAGYGAASVWAG